MSNSIPGTIPGVVNNSRLGFGRELFGLKDKTTYEHGFYVDTSYFSMIQPSFVKGSAAGFSNPIAWCSRKRWQRVLWRDGPRG